MKIWERDGTQEGEAGCGSTVARGQSPDRKLPIGPSRPPFSPWVRSHEFPSFALLFPFPRHFQSFLTHSCHLTTLTSFSPSLPLHQPTKLTHPSVTSPRSSSLDWFFQLSLSSSKPCINTLYSSFSSFLFFFLDLQDKLSGCFSVVEYHHLTHITCLFLYPINSNPAS